MLEEIHFLVDLLPEILQLISVLLHEPYRTFPSTDFSFTLSFLIEILEILHDAVRHTLTPSISGFKFFTCHPQKTTTFVRLLIVDVSVVDLNFE